MLGWLFSWEEAAKRPRRTVIALFLQGFVAGGVLGYFLFGHSVGWAVAFGLGIAVVLAASAFRTVRDPARVAQLTQRRPLELTALRGDLIRLALPFAALAVAVIAGIASASATVFVITLGVGLVAGLVLRRFVPR